MAIALTVNADQRDPEAFGREKSDWWSEMKIPSLSRELAPAADLPLTYHPVPDIA